ncbi:MAG TPA: hypothetical protein VFV13_14215 [Acidimicrobiia bacterium]|nr:hypothetical protein [Acidimicrobiia bacterium]
MSTSATQPGTTTGVGRSGKGLGVAAAALAVVIAAGFVLALNQGDEASVSNASTRAAEIASDRYDEMVRQLEAAHQASTRPNPAAELERLNDLAFQVRAQHPAFNIEKTKMDLAGQLVEHPGISPEKTRMEYLTEKLGEVIYVPSISDPAVVGSRSNGNLDMVRAQEESRQPAELDQPEWDNRIP